MLNNIGLPGLLLLSVLVFGPMGIYGLYNVASKDNQFAYAGFWLRAVALAIDFIVLTPVLYVMGSPEVNNIGVSTAGVFIIWGYFALLESSKMQATLGKRALGLRVVDAEGNRLGYGRAAARFFVKYPSGIIFLIGFIMAGCTKQKRALHDIVTNTLVIKTPKNITTPKQTPKAAGSQ